MTDFEALSRVLSESDSFFITGHTMPDGDCLGSVLGLGIALQNTGKSVVMHSPDSVPAIYKYLPGVSQLVPNLSRGLEKGSEVLIALDCSTEERLGDSKVLLEQRWKNIINIDHHMDNSGYGDCVYVDHTASATGEIIYNLLKFMDTMLTKDIATCIYTAILTDTGSFQYSNTTPKSLRIAADLVDLGAPAYNIANWVYNEKPVKNLKALEAALGTLKISPCGLVSWMMISFETQMKLGLSHEHTDGLVKTVRDISGVEVALLFRETKPGQVKVSLRSKYKANVSDLAARFGGGGHPKASGCVVNGELDAVVEKVVQAAIHAAQQEDFIRCRE